jgi:hypothetical protein
MIGDGVSGWFELPFTSYHGRIPFIIVDLVTQLRGFDAVDCRDLFNDQ